MPPIAMQEQVTKKFQRLGRKIGSRLSPLLNGDRTEQPDLKCVRWQSRPPCALHGHVLQTADSGAAPPATGSRPGDGAAATREALSPTPVVVGKTSRSAAAAAVTGGGGPAERPRTLLGAYGQGRGWGRFRLSAGGPRSVVGAPTAATGGPIASSPPPRSTHH